MPTWPTSSGASQNTPAGNSTSCCPGTGIRNLTYASAEQSILQPRPDAYACPWLRRGGDAGDLGPGLEGLGPGGLILGGGHSVTAEVEEVADPVMGGQKALCLAG